MSNIVRTLMLFDGLEGTNSTDIVSASGHNSSSVAELDDAVDFTCGEVKLNGIVEADIWVWESDGS